VLISSTPFGARQVALGQHLGQDSVLGRAEERRLYRDQEQHGVEQLQASRREGEQAETGRDDLERLGHHEHRALAERVGKLAGVARKQQERRDEDDADQRDVASRGRSLTAVCTATIVTTNLKKLSLNAPRNCVHKNG
jgi:hypothetical protein